MYAVSAPFELVFLNLHTATLPTPVNTRVLFMEDTREITLVSVVV